MGVDQDAGVGFVEVDGGRDGLDGGQVDNGLGGGGLNRETDLEVLGLPGAFGFGFLSQGHGGLGFTVGVGSLSLGGLAGGFRNLDGGLGVGQFLSHRAEAFQLLPQIGGGIPRFGRRLEGRIAPAEAAVTLVEPHGDLVGVAQAAQGLLPGAGEVVNRPVTCRAQDMQQVGWFLRQIAAILQTTEDARQVEAGDFDAGPPGDDLGQGFGPLAQFVEGGFAIGEDVPFRLSREANQKRVVVGHEAEIHRRKGSGHGSAVAVPDQWSLNFVPDPPRHFNDHGTSLYEGYH